MSARQRPILKRHSSKDYSSNNFDHGRIQQRSNENGNSEPVEIAYTPSIHTLGKEGLEGYVLAKLKTLGSHFPDNPEIPNIVTIIKKDRRKEMLNEFNSLTKERRKNKREQEK